MNYRNFESDIPSRKVQNSKTKEIVEFSIKLKPEEAVISAHAYLTLKDSDHTQHKAKYEALLTHREDSVALGEWTCTKHLDKECSPVKTLFSQKEEELVA